MAYPPPQYQPYPTPERTPGITTAAIVLMWILFGFGACGSVFLLVGGSILAAEFDLSGMPGGITALLVLSVIQLVVWTVLRGVFAVKIKRRSSGARSGAVGLEIIGLILTVVTWVASFAIMESVQNDLGSTTDTTDPSGAGGSCIGIVLSILIIAFLNHRESRDWCDR